MSERAAATLSASSRSPICDICPRAQDIGAGGVTHEAAHVVALTGQEVDDAAVGDDLDARPITLGCIE